MLIRETGLLDKWTKEYTPTVYQCTRNNYSSEQNNFTLTIKHLIGAFFLLFVGNVVALAIFLFEILAKKQEPC